MDYCPLQCSGEKLADETAKIAAIMSPNYCQQYSPSCSITTTTAVIREKWTKRWRKHFTAQALFNLQPKPYMYKRVPCIVARVRTGHNNTVSSSFSSEWFTIVYYLWRDSFTLAYSILTKREESVEVHGQQECYLQWIHIKKFLVTSENCVLWTSGHRCLVLDV